MISQKEKKIIAFTKVWHSCLLTWIIKSKRVDHATSKATQTKHIRFSIADTLNCSKTLIKETGLPTLSDKS